MKHALTSALAVVTALTALVGVNAGPTAPPAAAAGTPACQTDASTRHPIDRLAGPTRYATAACTSQVGYPNGADVAVLARGDNAGSWADALAGTVLAHHLDAPVLLTEPGRLPDDTAAEIRRLGVQRVVLLGGTRAISSSVERAVGDLGVATSRVAGETRADTAAEIARQAGATSRAWVVNGYRPADALVAGAAAARAGAGLLLTTPDGVPPATADAMQQVADVTVVGGFGVVSEQTEAALRRAVGGDDHLRRLGGSNRSETAATVARANPTRGTLHLVSGDDAHLVDAISASWLAAQPGGGAVLYAQQTAPGSATDRWLRLGGLDGQPAMRLVGGTSVLGDALVSTLDDRYDEAAAGGPAPEVRAFWVHLFDDSLKSRAGIEKVVDAAADANMNTIIVQAARRQDAYYDSDVLPRTPDTRLPSDLDVLGRLIPAAHAHGLSVHVWYATMAAYHPAYANLSLPDGLVWKEHGPSAKGTSQYWMSVYEDPSLDSRAECQYFMDPGVPAVQDHVVDMLVDVATHYDVDGVHLDYTRYAGKQCGYNPIALDRYHRETGDTTARPSGLSPTFSNWRRAQVADIVRRVYVRLAEVKPQVVVSMAAIAQAKSFNGTVPSSPPAGFTFQDTKAYEDKFQDWPSWVRQGFMDEVFPMDYFSETRYPGWFDWYANFTHDLGAQTGRTTALGQGSWLNTVENSVRQIDQARSATDGAVVYSYQQDSSNASQGTLLRTLKATRWATPAPVPAATWKQHPTGGHLLAVVGGPSTSGTSVTLTPTNAPGGSARTVRTDASGRATAVWLAPGTWRIQAGSRQATITVRAGQVTRATL